MQADFDELKNFNFLACDVFLWVFKKSTTVNKFNAQYVRTDPDLEVSFKSMANIEIIRLVEFSPYSYLAENHENGCLSAPILGSDFEFLKRQVDRPEPEHSVTGVKDLEGAEGYVVKFFHNGRTVYAVKKSSTTWKTAYPKKFINMVFRNGELSTAEDKSFSIEKNFDFYCVNETAFVAQKRAFESVMQYKTGFAQAFVQLRQNAQFSGLFTDLQPLIVYVGTNSIQLRRMATIEKKNIYSAQTFLPNLQQVNIRHGWGLNFDPVSNKIVPCPQTAKMILEVLLDHRLMSEVTNHVYIVPDAVLA